MGKSDNQLGMDRLITRRNFVNGVLATTAGTALIGTLSACGESSMDTPSVYPPRFTGMRGNHDSSFTVAHALGREGKTDWLFRECLPFPKAVVQIMRDSRQ